jgi:hypothetical protein
LGFSQTHQTGSTAYSGHRLAPLIEGGSGGNEMFLSVLTLKVDARSQALNNASQRMADLQFNQIGKRGVSDNAERVQRTLQKILTSFDAWNIVRAFSMLITAP